MSQPIDHQPVNQPADSSPLVETSAEQEPQQEPQQEPVAISEANLLRILRKGTLREQGVLPYSSNHSFLVTVTHDEVTIPAVYKPQRGETPLHDFEWGTLCKREMAAFLISQALGWDLIPPTVLRNGKYGLGSVQFYIDHDPNIHYFSVQEDARFALALRQLVLFDYISNNADRKSGHCLIGNDGRLWAIDHGICFHTEYKLRTVIWEFANEPISLDLLEALHTLEEMLFDTKSHLAQQIERLLSCDENNAVCERLGRLLQTQYYPAPHIHRRNYPWPPV